MDYSEDVLTKKGVGVKREQRNQVVRARRLNAMTEVSSASSGARERCMVSFEALVLRCSLGAARRLRERRRKQFKARHFPSDGLFHVWAAFCRRVALLDPLIDSLDGDVAGFSDRGDADKIGCALDG